VDNMNYMYSVSANNGVMRMGVNFDVKTDPNMDLILTQSRENLASGPESPQEAVRGWIASPPHCQNLMDPRFEELGVAFAATRSGEPRIYWVQVFASQR